MNPDFRCPVFRSCCILLIFAFIFFRKCCGLLAASSVCGSDRTSPIMEIWPRSCLMVLNAGNWGSSLGTHLQVIFLKHDNGLKPVVVLRKICLIYRNVKIEKRFFNQLKSVYLGFCGGRREGWMSFTWYSIQKLNVLYNGKACA